MAMLLRAKLPLLRLSLLFLSFTFSFVVFEVNYTHTFFLMSSYATDIYLVHITIAASHCPLTLYTLLFFN